MHDYPDDWQLPTFDTLVLKPKESKFVLVIPVINEGERIQRQLYAISDLPNSIDVVIADGGSTDGSLNREFLEEVKVRACLTKTGDGKLSAQLRIAYAWALQEGYEGIITIDGNGKDDVRGIDAIREQLEGGCGYVQGSRYAPGGVAKNTPFSRWFAGRFIHAPAISMAARHWFTDTTNGFRGYGSAYLQHPDVKPFRNLFQSYNLLFYLSIRASQLGFKVAEVGVTRVYPKDEETPTKIKGIGGKLKLLLELFAAVLGRYHPSPTDS